MCLACWFWRKIAKIFIYFENAWIIYDSIFVLQSTLDQSALVVMIRYIAVGILLGIDARMTILTISLGTIIT